LAIVTLVLWVITASAGLWLLSTGGAARRRRLAAAAAAQDAERPAPAPVRVAAIPLTPEGKPPPVPRVRVATPPGEHPLLEFTHPALATTGLAVWFMFTFIHYHPMAWIAFGFLLATICAGLSWLIANRRAVRHQATGAWTFPPRLIVLHGAAAAVAITLTVLTALMASRG
jgi:hypothetical protein